MRGVGLHSPNHRGFTLIELLLALAIASLLMAATGGVIGRALQAGTEVAEKNDLTGQARFAMERMVAAVRDTTRLMIPLAENPATAWSEAVRDPGVLAVILPPSIDRDQDGFPDADNDRDGVIDEDLGSDITNDGEAGIVGVDDDGDGVVHRGVANAADDDEDGSANEESLNGVDDDGDGAVDEDTHGDMNGDSQPGMAGADDDNDGSVDEGHFQDDDEDGAMNEDWIDVVVYFVNGTDLFERMPNLNPADGTDYTESIVAQNVTAFRVERVPAARAVLVNIRLDLTGPSGHTVSLQTTAGVGGGW